MHIQRDGQLYSKERGRPARSGRRSADRIPEIMGGTPMAAGGTPAVPGIARVRFDFLPLP
jgi:hypothetical protein